MRKFQIKKKKVCVSFGLNEGTTQFSFIQEMDKLYKYFLTIRS